MVIVLQGKEGLDRDDDLAKVLLRVARSDKFFTNCIRVSRSDKFLPLLSGLSG